MRCSGGRGGGGGGERRLEEWRLWLLLNRPSNASSRELAGQEPPVDTDSFRRRGPGSNGINNEILGMTDPSGSVPGLSSSLRVAYTIEDDQELYVARAVGSAGES